MNLLLNARRKQQTHGGHGKPAGLELTLEELPKLAVVVPDMQPIKNIRDAGQNLFGAKSPSLLSSPIGTRRNLLIALCGTILLLAAAAGYYWHIISVSNTRPLQPPAGMPSLRPVPYAAAAEPETRNNVVAETAVTLSATITPKLLLTGIVLPVNNRALTIPTFRENNPIRVDRQKIALADPLPNNAYLAYRSGNLDAAQQLYREMLGRDARNTDALLGLAVIAQQRGEDMQAAQYYSRVLALDPRNALAHAGISALTADDSDESRLKTLLNEQQGSSVLYFALGNRYAEQSRWDEAQQNYFNAYTLESGNAEFAFNLAVSLDHLGQSKLAAQYYQRALQLDQQESNPGFDHAQTEQRVRELTR